MYVFEGLTRSDRNSVKIGPLWPMLRAKQVQSHPFADALLH